MKKGNWLIFLIPSIIILISFILLLISFIISEYPEEKAYEIHISAEPKNESKIMVFNYATFYYDFDSEEGYFRFSPNQPIKDFSIKFPSIIKNESLKTYIFESCDKNIHSICNETEIITTKNIWTVNEGLISFPLKKVNSTMANIFFNETEKGGFYLIRFKLKDFEPSGMISLDRSRWRPVVLWTDVSGNIMFNLGNKYECVNCFYDHSKFEEDFWSSDRMLRFSIPSEDQMEGGNILGGHSRFKISTISREKVRWKDTIFTATISIIASMFAVIITFIFEIYVLRNK